MTGLIFPERDSFADPAKETPGAGRIAAPRSGRVAPWAAVLFVAALAVGLRTYRFEPPGTSALNAAQAGMLPPGLHHDEAFNTLAALRLLRTSRFEPFVRIDLGRLPIHIYLTTLIFAVNGGPLAVGGRLAALIGGLGSLVVAGPLAYTAFAETLAPHERRRLAWLVTAQLAMTYWCVHFSRLGMEHTQLTLFSGLAMLGLWWAANDKPPGSRNKARGRFAKLRAQGRAVLAGGLLGLAVYTYPAAYFLPLAVALIAIHLWLARLSPERLTLRFGLGYAAGLALVALPLLSFLWRYPEWVLDRPGGLLATSLPRVGLNALNAVGGLLWRGDINVSYNLPGRPFLDGIQAVLFALGLGVCLRRFRQPAYAFALIWLGVMLLPQALSEAPHFGRLSGATTPALIVTAVGGLAVWRAMDRLSRWAWLGPGLLGGLTLISAGLTARDYFVRWPQGSDFLRTFRVAERIEAELARGLADGGRVYLSPIDRGFSTVEFSLDDQAETRVKSFNGRRCSVLPPPGQPAYYLLTAYEETLTAGRLAMLYGPALATQSIAVMGVEQVRLVEVPAGLHPSAPAGSVLTPRQRAGDLMQPVVMLIPPSPLRPGADLPVTLIWQVIGETRETFTLGLYLLGPDFPTPGSRLWSQADGQPCDASYPTPQWTAGEWIVEERRLSVPPDALEGEYTLAAALYTLPDGARLPVADAAGNALGDLLTLARLTIQAP